MVVLDTDILSLLFAGQARVRQRAAQADEIGITTISRFEILRGRFDSVLKAANPAQLLEAMTRLLQAELMLAEFSELAIDAAAADQFGKLQANRKLKKIGRADLLIASIVLANRVTLITRNLRHFQQVPGLRLENWAD